MSADYQHLIVQTDERGVCTITLNRPERLNAVNVRLSEEIPAAITAAGEDAAVRVVVITGAGRGFCAGLDLDPRNLMEQGILLTDDQTTAHDEYGWVGRQALAVTGCPKPVIAAINGAAAGAGFGLALAADIRLIHTDAKMTAGYARRGLSPDAGVTYFLPRLVGTARAADIIMTARDVDAAEAERIGLVSRVLPAEGFADAVQEYAGRIAAGPPFALAQTKQLLVAAPDTDLDTQLKHELAFIKRCFGTNDVAEAMQAFLEKRSPRFTGK